jgi:mono/diheme cytochrome c family protein
MNDSVHKQRRRLSYILPLTVLMAAVTINAATAADYFNGREIYETYCQTCHGFDGKSMEPGMPDFSRGDALFRPDSDLFAQIRQGKGVMPAYRGMLTDSEIRDVIAYLRSLQK